MPLRLFIIGEKEKTILVPKYNDLNQHTKLDSFDYENPNSSYSILPEIIKIQHIKYINLEEFITNTNSYKLFYNNKTNKIDLTTFTDKNLNLIEYVKKYNNLDFTIKSIKLEKYEDIIENIDTENEIEELYLKRKATELPFKKFNTIKDMIKFNKNKIKNQKKEEKMDHFKIVYNQYINSRIANKICKYTPNNCKKYSKNPSFEEWIEKGKGLIMTDRIKLLPCIKLHK